jgi:hypothetical protein
VTQGTSDPSPAEAGLTGDQQALKPVDPAPVDQMRHDDAIEAPQFAQGEILDAGGLPEGNELQAGGQALPHDSHNQLRTHLADILGGYNFARRLMTLGGLTPYEYTCKIWTSETDEFMLDPIYQMPGLKTLRKAEKCSGVVANFCD